MRVPKGTIAMAYIESLETNQSRAPSNEITRSSWIPGFQLVNHRTFLKLGVPLLPPKGKERNNKTEKKNTKLGGRWCSFWCPFKASCKGKTPSPSPFFARLGFVVVLGLAQGMCFNLVCSKAVSRFGLGEVQGTKESGSLSTECATFRWPNKKARQQLVCVCVCVGTEGMSRGNEPEINHPTGGFL